MVFLVLWPTCSGPYLYDLSYRAPVTGTSGIVITGLLLPVLERDASVCGTLQERAQKPCASVPPTAACPVPVTRPVEQNAQPVPEGGCVPGQRAPGLAGTVRGPPAVHVPAHPRGEQVCCAPAPSQGLWGGTGTQKEV